MDSENEMDMRKLVAQQNRKKKSGGFQSMGLKQAVFNGIMKKGYKIPTPIQRRCIPIIMEGHDIVAMARTGSGKTAAFLIPMLEKLQARSAQTGPRAMILSPTRELATQTHKFVKELGKFTGLRAAVILGGDRMEDQFAAIHENPDIIIATPGRFMHVVVEMELKLSSVTYVVFDEADRLFEMGFAEQLNEILHRLPDNRQTLLFSATLPNALVDFAKAGLNEPTLIRLDVDSKLSDQLKLTFLYCRQEDKVSVLMNLLTSIIKPKELTVVFIATKHHVEYINMVLAHSGISCVHLYSSMDQSARKINIMKFQARKVQVLLVTDLAARGMDIPLLENVINFNFPAKEKLFVHRVGRVARAGKSGSAYSIVAPDEMAYVLDLHLFLGRPMKYAQEIGTKSHDWDGVFGSVPQTAVDDEQQQVDLWHDQDSELVSMKKVCSNAYKHYLKSRPMPSAESIKRMKLDLATVKIGAHPLFAVNIDDKETKRVELLNQMKAYKPTSTIFEINSTSKTAATAVMRRKRSHDNTFILRHQQKLLEKTELNSIKAAEVTINATSEKDEEYIRRAFSSNVAPKTKKKIVVKDIENFISYRPTDYYSEKGMVIDKNNFEQQAANAILDFAADDLKKMKSESTKLKWDRKKKKFVGEHGKPQKKKIKTESGVWIPATYKTDLYTKWQKKNKAELMEASGGSDDDNDNGQNASFRQLPQQQWKRKGRTNKAKEGRALPARRELNTKEEILKKRRRKEQLEAQKNKQHGGRGQRKGKKSH